MKLKKIIAVILLATVILSRIAVISYAIDTQNSGETPTEEIKWFYNQLSKKTDDISITAKKLYDALEIISGKDGKSLNYLEVSLDTEITDAEIFTQDELAEYYEEGESGTQVAPSLQEAMDIAKYAFLADNPEIFYIDFQKLIIKMTKTGSATSPEYRAYIGGVEKDDYYVGDGQIVVTTNEKDVTKDILDIRTILNSFENKVEEIIENKPEKETGMTENQYTRELVKYVHNEIIKIAEYKTIENATNTEIDGGQKINNAVHLDSPYGVLVRHEGSALGYSRTLKTILDRLGIPSVIVKGTYKQRELIENHIWNYVQIGEDWYAVDCKVDDLLTDEKQEQIIPNEKYLLSDGRNMQRSHFKSQIIGDTEYEIEYPVLLKENAPTFEIVMSYTPQSTRNIYPGSEFTVTVAMDDFINVTDTISAITGILEYSKEDVTMVGVITPTGDWNSEGDIYNPINGKFCLELNTETAAQEDSSIDVFTVKFQVNEGVSKGKVVIGIKDIQASNARFNREEITGSLIDVEDTSIDVAVTPLPTEITSNVYRVDRDGKYISGIPVYTTVDTFKENIIEYPNLSFEGLLANGRIKTGTIMRAGEMIYTLVVTGDSNGNGDLDPQDLMNIRGYCIDLVNLEGSYLKAADIDMDGFITVNDLALMRQLSITIQSTNETEN